MSGRLWFRLWAEVVDDEKLRLLAFEDRWHFVAILACKAQGILDTRDDEQMLRRKIAVKLGLQVRELEEVSRRLAEVGLICEDTLQPLKWDKRQFQSDLSTDRVRKFRERNNVKRFRNVSETPPETETETETEGETRASARKRQPRAKFAPPTLDEVRSYAREAGLAGCAQSFHDHFESNGWLVSGKSKMRDWKAAYRGWYRREEKFNERR